MSIQNSVMGKRVSPSELRKVWPCFLVAHEKWRSTILPSKQSHSEVEKQNIYSAWLSTDIRALCCHPFYSASSSIDSAQPLYWPCNTLDLMSLFSVTLRVSLWKLEKHPGWDATVEIWIWITLQTTSKCLLDLVCRNQILHVFFFLLSRLPKTLKS